MKILIITAHPRTDSLTANMTKAFTEGLNKSDHDYEIADLYAEKFNPLIFSEDEPDWDNSNKVYSRKVTEEMERIEAHDALVFIFPVWWYSLPALMKGYIDRVWNYGFAYGPRKLPVEKIRWIALAGFTEEKFKKRDYDRMMEHYLNVGLAGYCGVKDSKVYFMYNSIGEFEENVKEKKEKHFKGLLDKALQLGASFV